MVDDALHCPSDHRSDHDTVDTCCAWPTPCLILGQRLAEWCGHAPVLEEDIALANIALDLIGQARRLLRAPAH